MDISSRRTASPFSTALASFPGTITAVTPGASSYFTAPTSGLDPSLFDARENMHPKVQHWFITTLFGEMARKGFRGMDTWLRLWLAGSGASYQWSAARDPGDLDILLGVDYVTFRQAHVEYTGISDREISDDINSLLQEQLWKQTANHRLGQGTYEVTWYVNPGSTDIRAINPYAAFDIRRNEFTVRPIVLPATGPGAWFSKAYAEAAERDLEKTHQIVARYHQAAVASVGDGPAWMNASTLLVQAGKDAVALFDEIHQGRHKAFEQDGEGYRDFANYRWQRGKQLGSVPALRAIKDAVNEARKDAQHVLYGQELKTSEKAITAAALGRV